MPLGIVTPTGLAVVPTAGATGGRGPAGPDGPAGPEGPAGPVGPAGAGSVTTRIARVAIPAWSAVVPDGDGYCTLADPSNPDHKGLALGVCALGGALGASVEIQAAGAVDGPNGPWTAKQVLYVGAVGALTAIAPTSGWLQVVGSSSSASHMIVSLGVAETITPPASSAQIPASSAAQRASVPEVAAGTRNDRWVSPAGLKPVADAKLDVSAKASSTEAGDKTVTGKWLDPAGAALTQELAQLKVVAAAPAVPDWINRTTPYGPITFNLGGLPGACLPGGGTVAAFAAIQGLLDITTDGQNNLSTFAAGVSGIARARTSNPSPVGIFGGAMANTPDTVTAQVFGANFVATNCRDFNPNTSTGVKRAEIYCIETDMEVHPADDGSVPQINARGIWVTGNSRVQPNGEFTGVLVGPAGILRSPQVRHKKAFRSQEGAAEIALEACQVDVAGQSPSQPIRLVSTGPDGTVRAAIIGADPTSGVIIRTDSYVSYTDIAGNTRWSWSNLGFYPGGDNVQDIGSSSAKIRNLYIGNSPIVGSDARLKTLRGDGGFTDAELDAWGDVEPKVYRMKAAIAEKGSDKARLHAGYIAQEILAAFQAHDLDAFAYGLVCQEALTEEIEVKGRGLFKRPRYEAVTIEGKDGKPVPVTRYRQVMDAATGEPVYDPVEMDTTTTETRPTGETQLSVRYDECQVWQAAWMRREFARLRGGSQA